jgi:hypothetical protein
LFSLVKFNPFLIKKTIVLLKMSNLIFSVGFLFIFFTSSLSYQQASNPIVFVPGLGASCIYEDKGTRLWPPTLNDIIYSNQKLKVNNFLESTVPTLPSYADFNNLKNIEIIKGELQYFIKKRFGETFLKNLKSENYQAYALVYDFRIVPNPNYFNKLFLSFKQSIEKIYTNNSNSKIVIIAHSLGSLVINTFLNQNSNEWNKKYIDKIIFVNPPISGSIAALKLILVNTINIFFKEINIQQIQNFGGLIWCLPDINSSNILNIDGNDIEFNKNILPSDTLEVYNNFFLTELTKFKIKHKIITHLVLSEGIKTPIKLYLEKVNEKYKFKKYDYADGDGIILPLKTKEFNFVHRLKGDHSDILETNIFFKKIGEILKY